MIVMLDVQQQFWNYFQDFKKIYGKLAQENKLESLVIVGNKLHYIENKSQLNKIRPADDFPNANFSIPLNTLLKAKCVKKNVIIATGNLFSPINFIDVNVLKQDLLKSQIKIHCVYLSSKDKTLNDCEAVTFLQDLASFTEGKFFINTPVDTIIETGGIK